MRLKSKNKWTMIKLIVIIVMVLWIGKEVQGWMEVGHRVVAQLAQNRLTKQAQSWQAYLQNNSSATLTDICLEPDAYRQTPQGKWSAGMHFIDMPFEARNFDYKEACGNGKNCIVKAIHNYTARLERSFLEGGQEARNLPKFQIPLGWKYGTPIASYRHPMTESVPEPSSLSFLVHLFGDIHQPLHVGFACDYGGNAVNTSESWSGQVAYNPLHIVWDNTVILQYSPDFWTWVNLLESVIANNPSIVTEANSQTDASSWANDSFHLTLYYAYWFNVPSNPPPFPFPAGYFHYPSNQTCPVNLVPTLSSNYYLNALRIIQRQLILGGIRLANRLNHIFTTFPPSS